MGKKPPSEYLPQVRQRYPEALARQSVPENPALWEVNRFEDFLAQRREALAAAINTFLDGLLVDHAAPGASIEDYVAAGESKSVEFKSSLRWDHKQSSVNKALEKTVAKTIAAFMNSNGGTLVIGISDGGESLGIEPDILTLNRKDVDGWQQHLRNLLNGYLSKEVAALAEVSFAEYQGKTVSILRAEPSLRPVFLSEGPSTEFYIRSGNTSQPLDVKQTTAYVKQRFPSVT